MMARSLAMTSALLCALSLLFAAPTVAQHPHAPQPPVFVPPPPAPPVPPTLRVPQRPAPPASPPAATGPDSANAPEAPTTLPDQKIDTEKVPEFVYMLGDSVDIKAFFEPPKLVRLPENWCDWQCEAQKMFPDADEPTLEYMKWADEVRRIRDEKYAYIYSGDAIPKELRLEGMGFREIKYREDENGNGRFHLMLDGGGQVAVFSVAADDIDGGIAANIEKIRSVASHRADAIKTSAEWYRERSEMTNYTEASRENYLQRAKEYEAMLAGYGGPIFEQAPRTPTVADPVPLVDIGPVATAPGDAAPSGDPAPGDLPIVPTPAFDDTKLLVDTILADNTSLFDPGLIGGPADPKAGSDAALQELIRTTRDFGNNEILIDIDVVDNGNLAALADTIAKVSVDVGLAVVGAVNPVAGITIAFGKNAMETYNYAISKGLSTRQAIFAATTAGAVGGADTYIVGMGVGKVAGWVGPALKAAGTGATKEAMEHGIGTAGNASGFSLVGNVGKALVDKIAHRNANPEYYQRPKRDQPLGPGQVTYIMSGGGNWQQNAMQ